ncbi:hypothetical protein SprV_0100130300 [Sparganum proliferum]
MITRVADNGTVSEAFEVINGMKQGCVLTPTVFILMFSAMPMNVYPDEHPGILIVYRTDGHLNSRHMQVPTRLSTTTVQDLLFAADCALKTATEADTQCSMNFFTSGCAKFGPTSNAAKTVAMYQPSFNAAFSIYQIHVNDTQLKTVNNFAYLGSTLSRSVKVDSEVAHWIFKVSHAFGRMKFPRPLPQHQTLPPQLSPADSKAEVARQDLRTELPHALAWSITCESMTQRLVNQFLKNQQPPPSPHLPVLPSRM